MSSSQVFVDWKDALSCGKIADAVIIATQDRMYTKPAVAFSDLGYDILLEKPMATTIDECKEIVGSVTSNYKIDPHHPDYLTGAEVLKDQAGKPVSVFEAGLRDRSKGRSQIDTGDWDGDGDIDIMIGRPRGALGGGNLLYIENACSQKIGD